MCVNRASEVCSLTALQQTNKVACPAWWCVYITASQSQVLYSAYLFLSDLFVKCFHAIKHTLCTYVLKELYTSLTDIVFSICNFCKEYF